MDLSELLGDKETIILAALEHPAVNPKRKPDIDQAMKAVASQVEMLCIEQMVKEVEPKIDEMYGMYTLINGDWEDETDATIRSDWESGLDDKFEELLEPYTEMLSADWLGKNTIDCGLHEDGAVAKLAQSVGKETFKQVSYGRTPAQVLSSAGIVKNDVELYFAQHMKPKTPEEENTMAEKAEATLEAVCAKIKTYVGEEYDQMAVYDDIELSLDDDEILANGAGARLGLSPDDIAVLQMETLEHGDETANKVFELMDAAEVGKPKKTKAKAKPKAKAAEAVEGGMDPQVLALMKEHGGAKDTEMAKSCGVSRATYNNWVNGKTAFAPDDEQSDTLRTQLVGDVNGLLAALALFDGTEKMEVN